MNDGEEAVRDAGYDDFVDALAAGEGYFLACSNGHGSLPPRRVCPTCGDRTLSERDLPDRGTVRTYTVVSVAAPSLADDVPYVTAIADFGDVDLTGFLRGIDPDAVSIGATVTADVEETETLGRRAIVFRPA